MGFFHGEKPLLSEEGIRPAYVVRQRLFEPPWAVFMTTQNRSQATTDKAVSGGVNLRINGD